jgi:hypothetical protein
MIDPMRFFFGQGDQHGEHPESLQSDPSKYPRASEITDTEFLMTIQTMQANDDRQMELNRQAREIMEELSIVKAERQIMETKFWRALREMYPQVITENQCGMGYRKYDGKLFVVSWGDEIERENLHTEEEN